MYRGPTAHAGQRAGGPNSGGYVQIKVCGKIYKAHRLAFLYMTGIFPEEDVDHKNSNTGHNIWSNLRACSTTENVCNSKLRKDNTSGMKGVSFRKDIAKWGAKVCIKNKQIHLGYYDDVELAALVAIEARNKYHGAYARHL